MQPKLSKLHRIRHKNILILFFCLCLSCLTGFSCQKEEAPKATANVPQQERAIDVTVLQLAAQKINLSTELAGRVSAFQISEVRPQVSGILQKRLFEEGSDVKAGQVLYRIDPATYEAALDRAQASLTRAEANVIPAQLKMHRFKNLLATKAVSKQDYDDAEAAWKQATAEVGLYKAEVKNAKIQLGYTSVIAPISGRISRSLVTPGALVTASQATPLTTVQQLDPVYVDVTQSSTDQLRLRRLIESGKIHRSDETHADVRLILEDGTQYSHTGSLQFSDVSVEESTGSVTLRALFPNPDHILLPGMYVRTVLDEGTDEHALLVPHQALLRDAKGNASVYVVDKNKRMEVRPVRTSRSFESDWLINEGLQAGEVLIVEGLQKVRPGNLVNPIPLSAATSSKQAQEK